MKKKLICMFLITLFFIATYPINGETLNDPPIPNPGGPYFGEEGQELLFDASASTDQKEIL